MNEPIRILHVIGMMNRGGAEAFIMNIYRKIDRSKVQFDFLVHTQEVCAYDSEIVELGGRVYNALPRYTGFNHFEYVRKCRAFFSKRREYPIIHGHIRSTAAIYLYIAKQYGLKTIAHTHSTSSGYGIAGIARELLRYPIGYIADYLFACADAAGQWAYGGKAFRTIKNAIDCKQFAFDSVTRRAMREKLNMHSAFVVGHVGRLRPEKNHSFLLEIFACICAVQSEARLLLVGDGELLDAITKKATELNIINKVCFIGSVGNVQNYLQAMDVIVFPSIYEGLPVSIIESQAAGLPHVLSDVITQEVDMGMGLLEFVSLGKDAEYWAARVLSKQDSVRSTDIQKIIDSGYDVNKNVRFLQDFYLSISKN